MFYGNLRPFYQHLSTTLAFIEFCVLYLQLANGALSYATHLYPPADDNDMTCVVCVLNNNSSAVAEMGDRLATTDMGRKIGAAVSPF